MKDAAARLEVREWTIKQVDVGGMLIKSINQKLKIVQICAQAIKMTEGNTHTHTLLPLSK